MKNKLKAFLEISPYLLYSKVRYVIKEKERNEKRISIITSYLKNHEIRKLQVGTGNNILQGWLNTDLNDNDENIAFLDVGRRFPIDDSTFDFIYSEHMFEHLSVVQQLTMLQESFRILKKGGVLRIATPSIDFLHNIYRDNLNPVNKLYVKWAVNSSPYLIDVKEGIQDDSVHYCYVINNFFKAWGHQMIHNFESLEKLSFQVGFSEVRKEKVGESQITEFENIERHGEVIPAEFNKLETMVVEIVK